MRQEFQSAGRLQHARADPHRREAAPVRTVRESVFQEDAAEAAS